MLAHQGWYLVLQTVDLVHTLRRPVDEDHTLDTYMHGLAKRTVTMRLAQA
jgi:hypothetical protein